MLLLAPFDPDPECPFCGGKGGTHYFVPGVGEIHSRCECTNWSRYAELRRSKGLSMKQAMAEMKDELGPKDGEDPDACPF